MKTKERSAEIIFFAGALVSVLSVLLICLFLFMNAVPTIAEIGPLKFLLGTKWKPSSDIYGILPMILASVYVTGLSILFGVPLGILAAVYMAFFCPKRIYKLLRSAVELLAGIPSIVYGFFGLMVIVPFMQRLCGEAERACSQPPSSFLS